ncbi:MAG: sugar ABC transporter permease [Chloroflexi bacterium]|nr:sugar ABC transporter permease [Chloroflexota bacterium]
MAEQQARSATVGAPAVPAPVSRRAIPNPLNYVFTHPQICGPVFIAPWFLGFLAFTFGPFIASIVLSFLDWSLLGTPKFVGVANYVNLFTNDNRFPWAVRNTFIYVLTSVPLKQIIALAIAVLLNQQLKGIWLYRSIFYLPSVTSGVATAILWSQIFGYRMGILNAVLAKVGIEPVPWLTSLQWALPTLIFISLWNVGSIFVIYLAGLQGVPVHLYEAAEVDGATSWLKFWKITLPLITPSVFFNVVMGFIGTFKVFTNAFIMTGGGPADRTLTYVLYLWYKAFQDFRMGYASAMAWILFLIIMAMTLFQMWLSKQWVYYEGSATGRGM